MAYTLKGYASKFNKIVKQVEDKTGYMFDESEVRDILAYTVRKCEINAKGPDYIPILFENELCDYLMRSYINIRGEKNRQRKFAAKPAVV